MKAEAVNRAPVAFVQSLAQGLDAAAREADDAVGGHGSSLHHVARYVADLAKRAQRHEALDKLIADGTLPSFVTSEVPLPARTPSHVDGAWLFALFTVSGLPYKPTISAQRYLASLGTSRAYVDPQSVVVTLAALALRDRSTALAAGERDQAGVARERDAAVRDVERLARDLEASNAALAEAQAAAATALDRIVELETRAGEQDRRVTWLRGVVDEADEPGKTTTKRTRKPPAAEEVPAA